MLKKVLLTILSKLYIGGVKFRHSLFNLNILKSESFQIPIICVGNITVGGTGKTPMCELLIEHFSRDRKVALLSRGYGRATKGYREVEPTNNYREVGDEPLQMKCKYPEALVVVCEKRADALHRITKEHPEVELIIMDDGFQHRYVEPKINIIMLDYTRPFYEDSPLPLGSLRDSPSELHRANYFIITKCPKALSPLDMRFVSREFDLQSDQTLLFTRIENLPPTPLTEGCIEEFTSEQEVIILAGIGNPKPFVEMAESRYKVVDKLIYADHHSYTREDITTIKQRLNRHPEAVILTTEKDSVKLRNSKVVPQEIKERVLYTPIKMHFITGSESELLLKLEQDVREN